MTTDVSGVIAPLLAELGFKKRKSGVFTVDLGDDVLGWLGLDSATRHRPAGEVSVTPLVGVRHQEVERIVAECRGEKFHAYLPPTVHESIGYLLPQRQFTDWVFGAGRPDADVGADMVAAVAAFGLPFMQEAARLDSLCRHLDEGLGFTFQTVFRRPVAWWLAGDAAQALAALDESVAKLRERKDAAAEELRSFAAALRPRIEAGSA